MMSRRHQRVLRFAGCPCRRAISLIELTVAIAMLATLMSFGMVLLGLLFRADHVGQDALARQLSISRLSRQFRADVHAAREALATDDNPGTLDLTLDDGRRVAWSAIEDGVLRIVRRDDTEIARDSYAVPDGITTFVDDGERGVIALRHSGRRSAIVEHPVADEQSSVDVLVIEAAVGIETSGGEKSREPMSGGVTIEQQIPIGAFSPRRAFGGQRAGLRGEGGRRPDEGRRVSLSLHPSPRPSPPNGALFEFNTTRGGEGG